MAVSLVLNENGKGVIRLSSTGHTSRHSEYHRLQSEHIDPVEPGANLERTRIHLSEVDSNLGVIIDKGNNDIPMLRVGIHVLPTCIGVISVYR